MPRYVSTGKCVACVKANTKAHYEETMAVLKEARTSL